MSWKIEQMGPNEWSVRHGNEVHYAQTAEDAVKLMMALEASGR